MDTSTADNTLPSYEGLTFEKVWAMFQETDRKFQENREQMKETDRIVQEVGRQQKETDRLMKETREQMKETDRQIQETGRQMKETGRQMKETDRQMKETDRRLGGLGNRFGEMIEHMVMPNLVAKFRELGFVFTKAYPHATIEDEKNNIVTEIDITLENGDKVMIVEVKSKPSTENITEHIERMHKVKAHANLHGDKRIFLGAVAGMIFNSNERIFALKNGFYAIEPSGDTFTITAPEGIYSPKEW